MSLIIRDLGMDPRESPYAELAGLIHGFTEPGLECLYLLLDGAIDAPMTAYADSSGKGRNAVAHVGSGLTNPTRKSFGAELNSAAGWGFNTNVVLPAAGYAITVWQLFGYSGAEIQFPLWMTHSGDVLGADTPMPGAGYNESNPAVHKRQAMLDRNNQELPAAQYLPQAQGPADQWVAVAYIFDGPAGNQSLQTLGGKIGPIFDPEFITYHATQVGAGRTAFFTSQKWVGTTPVRTRHGLFAMYSQIDSEATILANLSAASRRVAERGETVFGI